MIQTETFPTVLWVWFPFIRAAGAKHRCRGLGAVRLSDAGES